MFENECMFPNLKKGLKFKKIEQIQYTNKIQ